MEEEVKVCRLCEEEKPISAFTFRKDSQKYRTECRQCLYLKDKPRRQTPEVRAKTAKDRRDWYRRDKEKEISRVKEYQKRNPDRGRTWYLKTTYGISLEEFKKLEEKFNGGCWICKKSETATNKDGSVRNLHVDHDHSCCDGTVSCGKCIRGLLCTRCNLAIGYLMDDPKLAIAAAKYLEK